MTIEKILIKQKVMGFIKRKSFRDLAKPKKLSQEILSQVKQLVSDQDIINFGKDHTMKKITKDYVEFTTSSGDKVCAYISDNEVKIRQMEKEEPATFEVPVNSYHGGYCVKCKEKREMQNISEVIMKNQRRALKGICPMCGTGMFKIIGKKADYSDTQVGFNPSDTLIEETLEDLLKEVCLEKTLTHFTIEEGLDDTGLEIWEDTELFVRLHHDFKQDVRNSIKEILKNKGYRATALSWEATGLRDEYSLKIKMI